MGLSDSLGSAVDKLNGLLGSGSGNWKDELHDAELNGIKLKVLESKYSGSFNNSVQNHPYNRPASVAQASRNPKRFEVSFFTSGKSWSTDRDKIISDLDLGGRHEFSDPYQGTRMVLVDAWEKTESLGSVDMSYRFSWTRRLCWSTFL